MGDVSGLLSFSSFLTRKIGKNRWIYYRISPFIPWGYIISHEDKKALELLWRKKLFACADAIRPCLGIVFLYGALKHTGYYWSALGWISAATCFLLLMIPILRTGGESREILQKYRLEKVERIPFLHHSENVAKSRTWKDMFHMFFALFVSGSFFFGSLYLYSRDHFDYLIWVSVLFGMFFLIMFFTFPLLLFFKTKDYFFTKVK